MVLPQPDSPTRPSVSPGRTSKSSPSTARTRPVAAQPLAYREVLGQARAPAAVVRRSSGHPRPDCARPRRRTRSALARRSAGGRRPGGRSAAGRAQLGHLGAGAARRRGRRTGSGGGTRSPDGRLIRLGGLPGIGTRSASASPCSDGTLESNPQVYGCCGARSTCSTLPRSTARPPYMTSTSSATWPTTPRSWVIRMIAEWNSRLEVGEQVQDLRLHGDVQRGGRLVGDQQRRVVDQGHRDHRPLAHAAGELVRVLVEAARRLRDADPVQHVDRPLARPRAGCASGGAPGTPRRSAGPPCSTGAAPTADPGRSSPCPGRAAGVPPRRARPTTCRPPTEISPVMVVRFGSCRPRMASEVTLLPEPDSPTMPRVRPRSTANDTPSTARTTPSSVSNRTRRSRTRR